MKAILGTLLRMSNPADMLEDRLRAVSNLYEVSRTITCLKEGAGL